MADHPHTETTGLEIALIGIAGVFPGAHNIDAFWQNLCDGTESITRFSDEELAAAGVPQALRSHPAYVPASATLDDVGGFDAAFFGYTPREAELLDPQARLFLECAWSALESAGYTAQTCEGRIGMYACSSINTYLLEQINPNHALRAQTDDFQIFLKNGSDFLATRISHKLNLTGPSITVQTACSSSLVAVHLAARSLLSGECDMAMAGGVSVRVPHETGYLYQEGGIFSPDGHCRAFDAQANGTVNGNGMGIVVLKRLEDALQDNDFIYAVIKGSALNNDGADKIGYTAPSIEGQAGVISAALEMAEVEAETISYIETHGTGTRLGDPIEIEALTQAFRISTDRKGFCGLGSVKSNIGHLDAAAGITSLIKAALALHHATLPPTLHYTAPNPTITFDHTPFYVNDKLQVWERGEYPRRAGVSAFGMGGTNAHVVLEEAPHPVSEPGRYWQLLILSARNPVALERYQQALQDYLSSHDDVPLADIAHTLRVGRQPFQHRTMVVANSHEQAAHRLGAFQPRWSLNGTPLEQASVVWMFPGQGSQYIEMGQDLYRSEPLFREQVDRCCMLAEPFIDVNLLELIYPAAGPSTDAAERLRSTEVAQLALFIIEYALAQCLLAWGIKPDALVGHSIGEYVAACLAGVFTLPDALRVVAMRGRLMQQQPTGAMLAVSAGEHAVQPFLSDQIALAAVNEPGTCVLAGSHAAIDALSQLLEDQNIEHRPLHTSHAFHSAMMDPILDHFAQYLRTVRLNPPVTPFLSNVTGTWITPGQATDPHYWATQIRQPVRFAQNIATLLTTPGRILVEVGPGRTLSTLAGRQIEQGALHGVVATMRHPNEHGDDAGLLLSALGQIWVAGGSVNWSAFSGEERRSRVPLPTYPFMHQHYWIDAPLPGGVNQPAAFVQGQKNLDLAAWGYLPSWKRTLLPASEQTDVATRTWLIFDEGLGWGAALATHLRTAGAQVVQIRRATAFCQHDSRSFEIDERSPDDYAGLIELLREAGLLPDRIMHLWSLSERAPTSPEEQLEHSFYSLLFLAQALGASDITQPMHLMAVANRSQQITASEPLEPLKAVLLGPCRVLAQEYPHLSCQLVDVAWPTATVAPSAMLIGQLIAESERAGAEQVVAYRGYDRWVQIYEHIDLPAARPALLRQRGVYVITGGLGGIGLEIASDLAHQCQARLVLLGRSAFPAHAEWDTALADPALDAGIRARIVQLRRLESAGAEVLIYQVDVADAAAVSAILADVHVHFGPVNGVIHAAGVPGGGIAQLKSREEAEKIFAPKIAGTLALASAFAGYNLDFFVLCSSSIAITGGFGRIDYCAANAFLDSFAAQHMAATGMLTVSINWDTWHETGMAATSKRSRGFNLEQAGGVELEHPLLHSRVPHANGTAYRSQLSVNEHWVLAEHRIMGSSVVPGTAYLELVSAAARDLLGTSTVSLHDIFFMQPLMVNDTDLAAITVLFEPSEAGYSFQIVSQEQGSLHVRGQIAAAAPATPSTDIQALLARTTPIDVTGRGAGRDSEMLELGPRWHSLQEAHQGDSEVLARFELRAEYQDDTQVYQLHPALLDEATGFAGQLIAHGSYLPFSYKQLRILRPLPAHVYSHARYPTSVQPDDAIIYVDLVLMNLHGEHVLEIEEFALRRVDDTATDRLRTQASHQPAQAVDAGDQHSALYQALTDSDAMLPHEGVEIFRRILAHCRVPQIVVSTKDLTSWIAQVNTFTQATIVTETTRGTSLGTLHPRPALQTPYVAPTNSIEAQIASVWQALLGIAEIGIQDNFFELGGDSLVSIQILSKLKEAGIRLTTQQMFQHLTIAELAAVAQTAETPQADQGPVTGEAPLTPIQHWFFEQAFVSQDHWNQSAIFSVHGPLDGSCLREALRHVLIHHDALRMRYTSAGHSWVQRHAAEELLSLLEVIDLARLSRAEQDKQIEAASATAHTTLSLTDGPLIRLVLMQCGGIQPDYLLAVAHHLVMDVGGWRLVMGDLQTAYQQILAHQRVSLPAKTTSFKRWAEHLAASARSEQVVADQSFWLAQAARHRLPLPVDHTPGDNQESMAALVTLALDKEQTRALLQDVPHAYQTSTLDVLITALTKTLQEWTSSPSVALELEGNSRDLTWANIDVSRTVGWFTTLYPLVLDLHDTPTHAAMLKQVKEQLRAVPAQGLSYGLLRYLSADATIQTALAQSPSPQVSFLYLGQLDTGAEDNTLLRLASRSSGADHHPDAQRTHLIEVNTVIVNSRLEWRWMYSTGVHSSATIEALAQRCLAILCALIDHCLAPEAGGYTPSDFSAVDLSQDDLDDLVAELDDLLGDE